MTTTCLTHAEDFLVSTVTGDPYSWIAYIHNSDDSGFTVFVTLIRIDPDVEKSKMKTSEMEFSTIDEAMAYITKTTAHFDKFSLKTLTFDQEYDEEFKTAKIIEWLDS